MITQTHTIILTTPRFEIPSNLNVIELLNELIHSNLVNIDYFGSDPGKFFGGFTINNFNGGARYMFSPKFGLKLDGAYDNLQNLSDESLDFEMRQIRIGVQGVVNAARLFDIQESLGRFGMLLHGGVQVAQMTPQMGINEGVSEWNGGIMVGFTPEFRISKNFIKKILIYKIHIHYIQRVY